MTIPTAKQLIDAEVEELNEKNVSELLKLSKRLYEDNKGYAQRVVQLEAKRTTFWDWARKDNVLWTFGVVLATAVIIGLTILGVHNNRLTENYYIKSGRITKECYQVVLEVDWGKDIDVGVCLMDEDSAVQFIQKITNQSSEEAK